MSLKKLLYNMFLLRQRPTMLTITYSFSGKGSDDTLYTVERLIPFDKPLKKCYVSKGGWSNDWNVRAVLVKEFNDFIIRECRKELFKARMESHIEMFRGIRVTGEYIVACDGCLDVSQWIPLTFEEWGGLND